MNKDLHIWKQLQSGGVFNEDREADIIWSSSDEDDIAKPTSKKIRIDTPSPQVEQSQEDSRQPHYPYSISDCSSSSQGPKSISPCPSPVASPDISCSVIRPTGTIIKKPKPKRKKYIKQGFAARLENLLKVAKSSATFWEYERIHRPEMLQEGESFMVNHIEQEFGRSLLFLNSNDVVVLDPDIVNPKLGDAFDINTVAPLKLSIPPLQDLNVHLGVTQIAPTMHIRK